MKLEEESIVSSRPLECHECGNMCRSVIEFDVRGFEGIPKICQTCLTSALELMGVTVLVPKFERPVALDLSYLAEGQYVDGWTDLDTTVFNVEGGRNGHGVYATKLEALQSLAWATFDRAAADMARITDMIAEEGK